jgi:hypothetical protein
MIASKRIVVSIFSTACRNLPENAGRLGEKSAGAVCFASFIAGPDGFARHPGLLQAGSALAGGFAGRRAGGNFERRWPVAVAQKRRDFIVKPTFRTLNL